MYILCIGSILGDLTLNIFYYKNQAKPRPIVGIILY